MNNSSPPSNDLDMLWYEGSYGDKFHSESVGISVTPPGLYFGLWSSSAMARTDHADDYCRVYAVGPKQDGEQSKYTMYDDIAIWRGLTDSPAVYFLRHTNPELLGFLHAQGVFACNLWNEIQDEWTDWTIIEGCYPQTPQEDEDQYSLRVIKAQLLYIREEVEKKFRRCDLSELSTDYINGVK